MRTLGSHGLPWVPRVPIRWMKRLGFGTHVAMDTCSPARQASEAACKQFAWKCIIVNHGVFMSTVLQVFSPTSWRSTWLMETEPSFVRRHLRRRCSLLNPFESTMAVTMVSLNYPGLETWRQMSHVSAHVVLASDLFERMFHLNHTCLPCGWGGGVRVWAERGV